MATNKCSIAAAYEARMGCTLKESAGAASAVLGLLIGGAGAETLTMQIIGGIIGLTLFSVPTLLAIKAQNKKENGNGDY
jgi:hypothetical protein